jgi:hypothetical protein
MPDLIDDDALDRFSVRGTPAEVGAALKVRYDGLADRIAFSLQGGFSPYALAELVAAATD